MLPGQQQPGGQIHGGFGAISPPAPSSRLLGSLLAALLPTSCIPSTLVQTNIYIYASIMFIIIYILLPSTPEQNTLTMWEFIRAYYKPVQAFNDHSQSWACETERQGGRNQMLG